MVMMATSESTGRGRLFIDGIIFVFELLAESPLNWGIDRVASDDSTFHSSD